MLSFLYGNLFILVFCFQSEAFLFTQKPPCNVSVSECMNCERVGFFPTMYCPQIEYGDFCYTKVVYNDSGIFTIKGPAPKSFCEDNKYKTSLLNPSCRSGNLTRGTECIDCCKQYSCDPHDLYCNKNIIQPEHMPFTVTTIRTTPPTTVSSTIATTQPTTPSTTPLPTSTQAPDEGLCQVCVEKDGQNCDTSSNHYCSQQKKYCMNTIISDPKGGMIVLKKCADEVECKWNYWVDTLGDPKCNNVTGPEADNACSYCCDNSNGNLPCNRDTIPKQLSTFDNSQEKKQCMTGNSNSQFQLETCSSLTSYCLNTVRYDTTATQPKMYVEKKCAYEAECKGEWWEKSRKRPECLTQNFTGIADNIVICNYCCVSDGSGPCNGASVPEQIAHFEPVTTASTPTTATTLPTTAHGHGHHNTHVHTDHGHHHTVTTTQTTMESTTTTSTLPSTTQSIDTSTTSPSTTQSIDTSTTSPSKTQSIDTSTTSPSTTAQTTSTTSPSTTTTTTTTTTIPTTTTTPAPIVCPGNTSIVCEDDPLAHCATLSSLGLCQKLQYNPDGEDIKFCPKTCNLCDKYCDYLLKPKQPPTTTPAPTHQMSTKTTVKPPTTTDKASTTTPNTTAAKPSTKPTTTATISPYHKSTATSNDQTTTATMATTSTNPTTTATISSIHKSTATSNDQTTTATMATTSTNPTTTATTATTTITIHTTTTAAHPECYICTGPVTLCENLYAPQGCTSDKPFCINDVNNNADGTRTVARRCVSKTECIQSWWLGSSSRSECAGFDPTSPTLDQFSCSFCCTTPLCNKNIVPRDLYVQ